MASRAVALQHAMAVAEHFDAIVAVKAAAFGVGDAFIGLQGRLLRAGGQFDGVVRGVYILLQGVEKENEKT